MLIEDIYRIFQNLNGLNTDSRTISINSLFIALKGEKFNGNKFAKSAIKNGARYAIIDDEKYKIDERFILVENCLETLQKLANFHRKKLNTKIIAITGSNGKTTTKELLYNVFKPSYSTICTIGNLNNHIGVPLSLLSIKIDTEIAIIEMGASSLGEIKLLCDIAEPNYGYITNFGKAHIEGFGSESKVLQGKSELYNYLRSNNGTIFFNLDDNKQKKLLKNYDKKFSFGLKSKFCEYKLCSVNESIIINTENENISSSLYGKYNVDNIMAAVCIGKYFKISIKSISEGISNYIPKNNRSEIIKKKSNTILLDAYNANPSSMYASIKNFIKTNFKNKILILGDMYELGVNEIKYHQEITDYCQSSNIKKIILIGKIFSNTNNSEKFIKYNNVNEFINSYDFYKLKKSTILVKGSRGEMLEKVIDYID